MKKQLKKLLAFVMLCTCSLAASADVGDEFIADGFKFLVTRNSPATVAVTQLLDEYHESVYAGDIEIPASVEHDGTTYSVTAIGERAFNYARNLKSVVIPNSVTEICAYAFYYSSNMTSVVIPNSVATIGVDAFYGCQNLLSIDLPNSITEINGSAFGGCSSLTHVKIPESVTVISMSTFAGCIGLKSVEIPNSVKEIVWNAFNNCTSLTSVVIPNSVTHIGTSAFQNCTSLTSVVIPNSVTSIEGSAFSGCSSLESFEIPNSIDYLAPGTFSGCTSLKSIVIPNSVTSIGDGVFSGCSNLVSVEIPNTVDWIGENVFNRCISLKSMELPNAINSIPRGLFYGCSSLTSVNIPNTVTSIGYSAFANCTLLPSIEIPEAVTVIGERAFESCTSMKEITSRSLTPPTCYYNAFYGININDCVIKVPVEALNDYKEAKYWKDFINFEAFGDTELEDETLADATEYTRKYDLLVKELTYTRNFSNTNWQALYVPFSMEYDEWADWADVAEIYDVHTIDVNKNGLVDAEDETVIEFRKVTSGALSANTPYVIRAKEAGEITKTFADKTLCAAESGSVDCSSVHWLYTLTGVYSPYADMVGKYALSDGTFLRGSSAEQTLSPQRFYLDITPRDGRYGSASSMMQAPKKVSISVDGEATGVEVVQSPESKVQSPAYNLQGQKVGADYKGIVIINGKKTLKR